MSVTHSVAGVLFSDGKYLIAKRRKNDAYGGKWEFPGGKIEKGENPEEALVREFEEEFEVKTKVLKYFDTSMRFHNNKPIKLLVYLMEYLGGEFKLHDHSEIAWVSKSELDDYDFLEVDKKIINDILNKKSN